MTDNHANEAGDRRIQQELHDTLSQFSSDIENTKTSITELQQTTQLHHTRDQLKHKEMLVQELVTMPEGQLARSEETVHHTLLVKAVEEAESTISQAKEKIQNPALDGLVCTPDHLLSQKKDALDAIHKLTTATSLYRNDSLQLGGVLVALSQFSQSVSEVMVQGAIAASMASAEEGQMLTQSSYMVGDNSLELLQVLKYEQPHPDQVSSIGEALRNAISRVVSFTEAYFAPVPVRKPWGRKLYSLLMGLIWLVLLTLYIAALLVVLIEFDRAVRLCGGRVRSHTLFPMVLGDNIQCVRNGIVAM